MRSGLLLLLENHWMIVELVRLKAARIVLMLLHLRLSVSPLRPNGASLHTFLLSATPSSGEVHELLRFSNDADPQETCYQSEI